MPGLTSTAALRATLPARFAPAATQPALGLAVSGGADSLALLLLAAEWAARQKLPPRLFVYSVDHGLRPEAAAEVAFVLGVAARLGLSACGLRWDGAKPVSGVQAAARAARYRLMGEAMRADGAGMLLTAHHARDQAETVLMRFAHGSGLDGLRGMSMLAEVEGVPVFRPLLDVPPELLRDVVAEAGLTPVADPGNADPHYERVRWRQALPGLAALGLDEARLAQLARRAGAADDALAAWADERFAALVTVDLLGAAHLPVGAFARLPPAVGVKLLARLLDVAGGRQNPRALGAVERLYGAIVAGEESPAATALGALIRRRGDRLWVSREPGRGPRSHARVAPAESLVWDRRFRITNRSAQPFLVRMAREFSRPAAERLLGRPLQAPAAAIRAAALVSTSGGEVLALGCYRLADGVSVELAGGAAGLPQS